MTHSLFIKSHKRDFPWLEWCKASIEKYCSGFSEIVLCLPEGEYFDWPGARIVHVRETFTGYLFQQAVKLYADQLCYGDFITFQDSDTIFTEPFTPESFKINEKPYWITRPYDFARPDQHVWRKPTSDFLGRDVEFEGMYRHPFTVHRSVLQRMRGFCQFQHGTSLDEYIHSKEVPGSQTALTFSEWNALGAFSWFHCRDQFHWIDASKEEPPKAIVHQGHTWSGDKRKLEDITKFREILGEHVTQGEPAEAFCGGSPSAPDCIAHETLTEKRAIEFLASQVKDNFHKARIIRQLQLAWKGKGEAPRKKKLPAGVKINPEWEKATHEIEPSSGCIVPRNTGGALLCIHSYPGANETFERHFPWYNKSGATRIVGVGTTDGKCKFPCDWIILGENSYMKLKGHDDHLCRRLIDTLKWCLTQPEERFIIAEYDTIFLKKIPKFKGVCAVKTGGKVNGSIADSFYHNPWLVDREAAPELIRAMEEVLPLSGEYPNNSPDIFFGLAVERAQIKVTAPFKLFTRNTIDSLEAIDEACEAALEVHAIHGVKDDVTLTAIEKALNDHHLALSHVA